MSRRFRICAPCGHRFTPMSSGQVFCRSCLKLRASESLIADLRAEIHGEWSKWLVGVITPHLHQGTVDVARLHRQLLMAEQKEPAA